MNAKKIKHKSFNSDSIKHKNIIQKGDKDYLSINTEKLADSSGRKLSVNIDSNTYSKKEVEKKRNKKEKNNQVIAKTNSNENNYIVDNFIDKETKKEAVESEKNKFEISHFESLPNSKIGEKNDPEKTEVKRSPLKRRSTVLAIRKTNEHHSNVRFNAKLFNPELNQNDINSNKSEDSSVREEENEDSYFYHVNYHEVLIIFFCHWTKKGKLMKKKHDYLVNRIESITDYKDIVTDVSYMKKNN